MKRALVVVGVLLLLAAVVGVIVLLTRDPAGERSASWLPREEPSSSDALVEVLVLVGNSCNEFRRVEVDESDAEVRLRAIVYNSGAANCDALMQTRQVAVELAEPVGKRDPTGCKNEHVDSGCEAPTSE